jgi:hypothetical protein
MSRFLLSITFFLCLNVALAQRTYKYFDVRKQQEAWTIGIGAGAGIVYGDVKWKVGYQANFMAQKMFRPWMDFRMGIGYGTYKGQDYTTTRGFLNNNALNGTLNSAINYTQLNPPETYMNYTMSYGDASIGARWKPIQIFKPKYEGSFDIGILTMVGLMLHVTKSNLLSDNKVIYQYGEAIQANTPAAQVKTALDNLLDKTYETRAQVEQAKLVAGVYSPASYAAGGFNLRYKFKSKFGISWENLLKYTNSDLLDGQQWTFQNGISKSKDAMVQSTVYFEYMF